jgi:hypothetical protein
LLLGQMRTYKENIEIRNKLKERWGIEHRDYWIPLDGELRDDIEVFNYGQFQKEFGTEKLKEVIKDLGHEFVNELNEADDDAKVKVEKLKSYKTLEFYYTPDNVDWVIYVSHENTIAIGGQTLLDRIKEQWTQWTQFNRQW